MTPADWVILILTALLAVYGYSRGFVVGAMSLAGFIVGAMIGARLAPLLLSGGSSSPYSALLGLGGALLVGAILGALFEGVAVRVRRLLVFPGMRLADGLAGAVLTGAIGLGIAWILGAVLLQSAGQLRLPPSLRRDIQDSTILRSLNGVLPPSGPILNALARIDPLPVITGPAANVPAPDRRVVLAPDVRAARASVVRILGQACGLGVEGSGWVAAPGLVVTNAHVVAGERDTVIQVGGVGPDLAAEVVLFDPRNDVAILRVPGLRLRALPIARRPAEGQSAAILGYPEDGAFNAQPGRLGHTQVTATQNAYGQPALRLIASLRGLVRPGNSGGPMVDPAGQVIATVFAEVTDAPKGKPGGFAVPNAVVSRELRKARNRTQPVSTEGCAD
jgi:S1-C subfamily serine protease/uncharacterized membrane protein required for colicin V production